MKISLINFYLTSWYEYKYQNDWKYESMQFAKHTKNGIKLIEVQRISMYIKIGSQ